MCVWLCVVVCGCVAVWLCGCGCVAVWLCGCVAVWLCGCVSLLAPDLLLHVPAQLSSYLATADWTQAALRELLSEAASSPVAVRGDATIRDTVEAYVKHCIATKQYVAPLPQACACTV